MKRILLMVLLFATSHAGIVAQPSSAKWTPIGKGIISPNTGDSKGRHHQSGRLIQAAWRIDKLQKQNVLWMGAAVGGLWKAIVSKDGHVRKWIPLTDNFPGPHVMGAFLVHSLDSNRILIGPGSLWDSSGDGSVYQTSTQGAAWQAHKLPVPRGENAVKRVNRLVEDRSDPSGNTVLAATSNGIYRSRDFGNSWERVFEKALKTSEHADEVTDLVQNPGDHTIWIAAALMTNVILRSTDSGSSWQRYVNDAGKISGSSGRVSLAACESDPTVLYALVIEPKTATTEEGQLKGVYRSMDRGGKWTSIFTNSDGVDIGTQGLHTCAIACDPLRPNHVVFGLKQAYESNNATAAAPNFNTFDGGHGDYNFMLFRPGHANIVMVNDGGYYIYHPFADRVNGNEEVDDSGNLLGINATFLENKQGGLASSRSRPEFFIAGLVDNGLVRGDAIQGTLELMVGETDGGQVSIMPDNADVMAASTHGITAGITSDFGQNWTDFRTGLIPDGLSFKSVLIDPTPFLSRPQVFTYYQTGKPGSSVSYWDFLSALAPSWRNVSPGGLPGEISHLDHTTDPTRHTLIITVKRDSRLFELSGSRTQLGSLTLTEITPLRALRGNIDAHANADKSSLQPHTLYYTTAGASPSRAFVSTTDGLSWHDVTGDLLTLVGSDTHLVKLIGNPRDLNQLFIATSKGVFRTDTGEGANPHWRLYSKGLRLNEEVQDIVINSDYQNPATLFIATRGRGFWQRAIK